MACCFHNPLVSVAEWPFIPPLPRAALSHVFLTLSPPLFLQRRRVQKWEEVVGMTPLRPGYEDGRRHYFTIDSDQK